MIFYDPLYRKIVLLRAMTHPWKSVGSSCVIEWSPFQIMERVTSY